MTTFSKPQFPFYEINRDSPLYRYPRIVAGLMMVNGLSLYEAYACISEFKEGNTKARLLVREAIKRVKLTRREFKISYGINIRQSKKA